MINLNNKNTQYFPPKSVLDLNPKNCETLPLLFFSLNTKQN